MRQQLAAVALTCLLAACGRRVDLAAWLNQANAAYTQGDYQRAAWILYRLKQRRDLDDNANVRVSLGACYLKMGWLAYAGGEFSRAIAFDSTNVLAWLGLGSVYACTNEYRKAIDCYLHARQYDPQNATVYRKLGNALFAIHEYAQAADHYLYAATLGDENDDLFATVGYCYERTYQWQKAVNAYLKAYNLNARNTRVILRLAILYRDQFNNMVATKKYYDILCRINPQVARAEARAFEERLRSALISNPLLTDGSTTGDITAAVGATNVGIAAVGELQRRAADYFADLARRSILNDLPKEALRYYNQALSNDPSRVHYYKSIAELYEKSFKDLNMAIKYYDRYLEACKDRHSAEFDATVAYVRQLRDQYVQQDAERQRRQAEEDERAQAEQTQREQDAAQRQREFEAARQSAETYDALLQEGARYMSDDNLNLERAREAYQKAINLNPLYPNAYYNLGLIYYRQTNMAQSVEYFDKALVQNPRFADAHLALGMAYERMQRRTDAIEHCQLYLEIAPNGARAEEIKQWLERNAGAQ